MEPFDLFPFVSEIKSDLDKFFKLIMNAKRVTLVAEPKLNQLLSLSFLIKSFVIFIASSRFISATNRNFVFS